MADDSCAICQKPLKSGEHYVVRIEVFADPAMPATSETALQATDFSAVITDLLSELNNYTVDELQDQVHRKYEYKICYACQARFLANPLGKPRVTPAANN
jgi:hypothetical protein